MRKVLNFLVFTFILSFMFDFVVPGVFGIFVYTFKMLPPGEKIDDPLLDFMFYLVSFALAYWFSYKMFVVHKIDLFS